MSRNKLLKNVDIKKIDLSRVKGRLFTISEGQIIYREGDSADIIYLVINGEINLLKKRMLGKPKSYIFSDNDFFGHDEFFEETTRFSTAVALRDSYLISLSKNEVDELIKQDDEIYVNLRQPSAEIEQELLRSTFESTRKKTFESEPLSITESESKKTEDDFFKSFATTSGYDTSKIIQPIESLENPPEPDNDAKEQKFEEVFLNEDGIPKAEVDLTQFEESELEKETPVESKDEIKFEESSLLNEDGIPKSEFELPETPQFEEPIKQSYSELDDALFSILSGGESPIINPPADKTNETIPDINLFQEELTSATASIPETFEVPTEPVIETPREIIPEAPLEIEKAKESLYDYEAEEIFAEADKQLSEVNEPGEQELNSKPISEEEEMGNDQLKMIIKAAELVNSTIKIDEVLKNIVEVATDLTNAERGTLYLVDREKAELWSLIAMGSERKEIRVKLGEGLSGFVAKTGEILNIKDARRDPRWRSDFDKSSGFVTKNVLTFPIKNNKEEIIGVLQLLNSRNGEFSSLDEELLNAMSIHAALALQNAEMVEKLLQGERIQSLGKMANFLIQDIKKPILVSKRYVEHLKTKTLPPDSAQIVEMLNEQLSQVADLVQTTSSYSEGKTILRTLNVSLNNTLADYASRINAYVESRNCQIIAEYDKDITVKLDVKEFYQCYMHIIKNACDAMPDGGNIYISTKRDDKEKRVKLFFRDNGLGIAESLKEKIFEPFFTQGKKEGAGLGLSITRKVVEAHNGKIDVQSALGEGATFIITLPSASSV
ncbi:MAG: GAF domain-containing protein [Ignavibacteria bacterium]|nr:GAF domain-containing protein [Ignavibacteria bacterium]